MKLDAAITVSISLIQAGIRISEMVQAAAAAGKDHVSDENWVDILATDKAARDAVLADLK